MRRHHFAFDSSKQHGEERHGGGRTTAKKIREGSTEKRTLRSNKMVHLTTEYCSNPSFNVTNHFCSKDY